ncbi:hypothetical protein [Actinomadura sp. NPDC048394]|uniref:hypothetical protein n=1 Tax=Actinomadura sp. NPDC048394 TaxID=3158223 RepID=UPI0033E8F0B0
MTFSGSADFGGATFSSYGAFDRVTFLGDPIFREITLKGLSGEGALSCSPPSMEGLTSRGIAATRTVAGRTRELTLRTSACRTSGQRTGQRNDGARCGRSADSREG